MVEIADTEVDESEVDIDIDLDEEVSESPKSKTYNHHPTSVKTKREDTINKNELIENILNDIARNLLFIHDKTYLPEIRERARIIAKDMMLLKKLMG